MWVERRHGGGGRSGCSKMRIGLVQMKEPRTPAEPRIENANLVLGGLRSDTELQFDCNLPCSPQSLRVTPRCDQFRHLGDRVRITGFPFLRHSPLTATFLALRRFLTAFSCSKNIRSIFMPIDVL